MRREADTYRSHGLPREAMRIYQDLLASAPRLPVTAQAAIRDQVQRIKIEIQCDSVDECSCLSDEHIALLRQGWSAEATAEEIVVSAGSFCELGCYAEALKEFNALIRKGVPVDGMGGLLASCLRHLHRPENLAAAVGRLASETCRDPAAALSLQVAIAENLHQQGHIDHAVSLVLALNHTDRLGPAEVQRRLAELKGKLARARLDAPARETSPLQDDSDRPAERSVRGGIRSGFRQFVRRLRAAVKLPIP